MKNLEQIRALHAHRFWNDNWPNEAEGKARLQEIKGEKGGDVVRGLSALIITNGLLATLAFAKEKKKGYQTFMVQIGEFLSSTGDEGRQILPQRVSDLDEFITVLTENDSPLLQRATDEALAYLGYLKRFRSS